MTSLSGQPADGVAPMAAGAADDPGRAERPASTIAFPHGLPGFPGATRFTLMPVADAAAGLLVLQSVDEPDLRFLVLPYRGSALPLGREDLERACAAAGVPAERAAVLLVVTRRPPLAAGDGAGQLFVNLRAPVLVDTERRIAVQCVLPSPGYSVRHPLAAAA